MYIIATGFSQSIALVDGKPVKGLWYFDGDLIANRTENGVELLQPKPGAEPLGKKYEDAEQVAHEYAKDHNY